LTEALLYDLDSSTDVGIPGSGEPLIATKARLYFARRKLIALIGSEFHVCEQLPSLSSRPIATPAPNAGASRAVQR
jgi:hypothetical protein